MKAWRTEAFLAKFPYHGFGIKCTQEWISKEPSLLNQSLWSPPKPNQYGLRHAAASDRVLDKPTALDKDFKLNIEVNHANLAGHTFPTMSLQVVQADASEMLGSMMQIVGNYQNDGYWSICHEPSGKMTEGNVNYSNINWYSRRWSWISIAKPQTRNSTIWTILFLAHIGSNGCICYVGMW